MRIAFDINGVLRNTFGKAEQVYQKFYIDEISEEDKEEFEYGLNLPVTSMNLIDHFKFPNEEDIMDFFYVDFTMNIFGHAGSVENSTFHTLNDIYYDLRDENDLIIISNEIEKSKPATLFFLSKYGVLIEKVIFFSKVTQKTIWKEFDILVTANPDLIKSKRKSKTIVKFKTTYNEDLEADYTIESLEELKDLYKELKLKNDD